jgi:vancomycin resistance protein VanJ
MRRWFRGIVTISTASYTGALLALILMQRTPLHGVWWVRLAGDFLLYMFFPLLLLLPLAILSKSRLAGAVISVPCLLFLALYGNLFVPRLAKASDHGEHTLTVMSYNVNRGDPGIEQILSIIEHEDPDVVALQDLSPEVAEALSSLEGRYPYLALHPRPDGYSGSGVLSRFPIVHDEAYPLVEGMHLYQHVVLDVEGRGVGLLNVHLQPPQFRGHRLGGTPAFLPMGYVTTVRDRELDRLIEELDGLEGTVLAVGDFNMTDQSAAYRRLTRRLGDAHREAGWGFGHTFPDGEVRSIPTPFPLVRIDYIFHSGDVAAAKAYVGDSGGPDHRFLVAELSF